MVPLDDAVTKVPSSLVPVVVSVDEIEPLRSSAHVVFADVRWYLDGRDGRTAYNQGHLPGAMFVDIDHDLARSSHDDPTDGRHPFPPAKDFAAAMSRLGISDDTHVIAYDDTGGMTASRLVVMLRMIGRQASLLDGGIDAWTRSGGSLEGGQGSRPRAGSFTVTQWPRERRVTKVDMAAIVFDGPASINTVLLDARAANRFTGEAGEAAAKLDPRPGHIPGAFSAPWNAVIDAGTSCLKSVDDLRAHYSALNVDQADDVICYCGSGVSACLNLVAIEHAGLGEARLYVPSYSGWASNTNNRVELGDVDPSAARTRSGERAGDSSPSERVESSDTHHDPIRSLRQARQRNRLAQLEWFEALYRVYLAAFIFGGGILFLSGLVPDDPVSDSVASDVWSHGSGWLGIVGALAVAMGLRSGSRGGPLSVEEADVRHLLLAPVDRRRALARPAFQRLRSVAFASAGAGAVAGELAGRRLPGSAAAWTLSGAAWGAVAGVLFVGVALISHAIRLRGFVASGLSLVLIAWQIGAALPSTSLPSVLRHGPADSLGGLALWGWRSRTVEIAPIAVALAVAMVGLLLVGRSSLEALARRSALVTQLRFAVTMQDLRTVTLLRRQLSQERTRTRPWIRLRRTARNSAEWRRGWHGLLRFPLSRILRIVTLTIVAGLCGVAVYNGTASAVVGVGVTMFILGLELAEPLAQEVDHGDRTDAYPTVRGSMYLALLSPTLVLVIPVAALLVATMGVVEPHMWGTAAVSAVPMLIAGLSGAAINIVSGAPDPVSSTAQQNMMPPEVAGTASVIKSVFPVAIAIVGGFPLVGARSAATSDYDPVAMALRVSIAVMLLAGVVGGWVRFRDDIKSWFNNAAADGRTQRSR